MKQHRPQFPCLLERLEGEEQFRSQLFRSSKALEVCDALMRLDGEFKSRKRCIDPTFQESFGRETPEGIVHFDGVQACGVVTQELAGGQPRRIKIRLPTGICPTRRTSVNSWHRSSIIVSEDLVCFIFSRIALRNAESLDLTVDNKLTSSSFCTKASERVYVAASRFEIGPGATRKL